MYKSYSNKLWKFVLHKFSILFNQYLLLSTLQYAPEDGKKFLKKVENEREIIFDIFTELLSEKEVQKGLQKLDLLVECFILPSDKVVVSIANLKIQMKHNNFNNKCIKCILRMRTDITRQEKKMMFKVLEKQACKIKNKERQDLGKMFKKTIMTDMLVHQFCEKFKARFNRKKQEMRQKVQNQLNNELLKIEANERVEIEEESISLRGFLGIAEIPFNDDKKKYGVIKNIKKCKFIKMHFSFLDDIIVWRKKPTSKKIKKRVYLVTIDDLGVEGQRYFWFNKKDVIFCIECQSEEQRRLWIKALVFLRQESLSEIKPLEFEEFKAVQGSAVYQELFDADEVNYDYEHIKINKKVEREKKQFNIEDIEVKDKVDDKKEEEAEKDGENHGDEIRELSIEELSDSEEEMVGNDDNVEEEEEESDSPEEEGEEVDSKAALKKKIEKKAKKTIKKNMNKIKGALNDFKATEGQGDLYTRAKRWFGFY